MPKIFAYYQISEYWGFWAAIEKATQEFIGWFLLRPALDFKYMVDLGLAKADEIELGYRLRQKSWGQGYATEGAQAIIKKVFQETDYQKITAIALADNRASWRVMEKVGLTREQEFTFTENQLPNFSPEQRKAVKYLIIKPE